MIKRLLPLLLSLLLLGCSAQNPIPESAPAPDSGTINHAPLSMEPAADNSGLSVFRLSEPVSGLLSLEGDLLLTGNTGLYRLDPDSGTVTAHRKEAAGLTAENIQLLQDRLLCLSPESQQLQILTPELKPFSVLPLPQDVTGRALLSADGQSLYYCTADALRVLETGTGISRVLKLTSHRDQQLTGLLIADSILQVCVTDADGSRNTLFLSTDTGQLLHQAQGDLRLETDADRYGLRLPSGSILFGTSQMAPMVLHPLHPEAACFFLPDSGAAVTAATAAGDTLLTLYDLNTGRRTAEVSAGNGLTPTVFCQTREGDLWFLTAQSDSLLYRWDPASTAVSDLRQYTGSYYTRKDPDYDGLAACALLAEEIGETYGLDIRIYREAVETAPWDYRLDYEHDAALIRRKLELLQTNLQQFPPQMLQKLTDSFSSVRISLVGSITHAAPEDTRQIAGVQFLEGYTACIALSCRHDTEYALFHELSHLMETVVLTQSTAYDRWNGLNPEGFQYGRSPDREWLQPGREYFIDGYAMSQPDEDRARLFEYAMTPGHEDLFRSPHLQAKLKQLCHGLRQAFDLEEHEGELLWEQYLDG